MLPHVVRASVLRAESVLQRDRRITQAIVDWADRRLTPEWMNAAYDAWGLGTDDELPLEDSDLFTAWAVYHFAASDGEGCVAAQWLAAQQARHRARTDADTVALVEAHRASTLSIWEITDAEPGVGLSVRDKRGAHPDDDDAYVYDAGASHDLSAGSGVLAYVMSLDDVSVFAGLHEALLTRPELDEVLNTLSVSDTLPDIRRHWLAAAERYYDRTDPAAC